MDTITTEDKKTIDDRPPIINCHTHTFTGDHVPPLLGRSIIQWPFYYLVNFRWVFFFFRKYYRKAGKEMFDGTDNLEAREKFERKQWWKRNYILATLLYIAGIYFTIQTLDFIYHWLDPHPEKQVNWLMKQLRKLHGFFDRIYLLLEIKNIWLQAGIIAGVFFLFKTGRRLLWFIAKNTISIIKKVPGKQTKKLFERYLTIGRFAFHKTQKSTFGELERQYPSGTGFVVLPMDMEYMAAGKVAIPYKKQMEELAIIKATKKTIYPFVFVDPRRIKEEGKAYFNYHVENGKVILDDCFIKNYIEGHTVKVKRAGKETDVTVQFNGFKIYPALGYFPFDPLLLPLWKYAAQQQLPVLTHCVRGPMYYRGSKKGAWNKHTIYKEVKAPFSGREATKEDFVELLLPQIKNDVFSADFTHPMNFLCLLEKELLRKAVNQAYKETKDEQLKQAFGLTPAQDDDDAIIQYDLHDLKICLGHYGGDDEWKRYFEQDRYGFSNELSQSPLEGIDFLHYKSDRTKLAPGKPEQLWKHTDWYSIISSMMIRFPNVYADISFILHNDVLILPLLKQTLQNPKLREKVLYGTDFYVVRNLKSDKQMLADMMGGLDEKDFDQIARYNPRVFLNLPKYVKPVQ